MRLIPCTVLAAWLGYAAIAAAAPFQQAVISAPAYQATEEQGFDAFYSLEYDRAIAIFQKLRDDYPGNSAFENHLAAAYVYKQLLVAGFLQGDLFASSDRFFRTKKIQPDALLSKKFWAAANASIRLCEQRLKINAKDEDALYDCGIAYATKATYQGIIDRAKLGTLSSGRKASDYHTQLIELNPRRNDAYFIPGLYQYAVGSLPSSLKFLLFFAGISGDKEEGIRDVENTAQSGNLAKVDAKVMLTVMYRREKRYSDARRMLADLAKAFPRNYIFPLEIASVYHSAGEDKEAIHAYEQMLDDVAHGKPGFDRTPLAQIHFELGQLYWKLGDLTTAKAHLSQVNGSSGSNQLLEDENASVQRQVEEAIRARQPR